VVHLEKANVKKKTRGKNNGSNNNDNVCVRAWVAKLATSLSTEGNPRPNPTTSCRRQRCGQTTIRTSRAFPWLGVHPKGGRNENTCVEATGGTEKKRGRARKKKKNKRA